MLYIPHSPCDTHNANKLDNALCHIDPRDFRQGSGYVQRLQPNIPC